MTRVPRRWGDIKQRRRELTIVSAAERLDTVRMEVRDTGPGLDPDRTPQLFEAFYRTKAEGLGIGLSIGRWIVEAHGGPIVGPAEHPVGRRVLHLAPGRGTPVKTLGAEALLLPALSSYNPANESVGASHRGAYRRGN